MSALEQRSLGELADIILSVRWQNLLEVWEIIRKKMDAEGSEAVQHAFDEAKQRFLEGPFEDHIEVRWGMNLCPHCNDSNVEKNGIAYSDASGDGLEFNQCLNCRIGILYTIEGAVAELDTYTIALGQPGEFNGYSIFWDAIIPESLQQFLPTYQLIKGGQWAGAVSVDDDLSIRYLAFDAMTEDVARNDTKPWTRDLPQEIEDAMNTFFETAEAHIEVALALADMEDGD